MEELLRAIDENLRAAGYTTVIEEGIVKARHLRNAAFWVLPVSEGALFRALFQVGPNGTADPSGLLQFVNHANQTAIVSRFAIWTSILSVEAWFPNCYERQRFENFFERYLADMSAPARHDLATAQRFFPATTSQAAE